MVMGPESSQPGVGIEPVEADHPRAGTVMIASYKHLSQRPHLFYYFIGVGAIADNVPKIENLVAGGRSLQAGIQRFLVGVNIG
jgi:hypothetical protein